MADIKTPEERSKNMAAIKGKDTKPEVFLRKKMFAEGYRYRKNSASVNGHPDLWLRKYNTAVFVHGCFWHRHADCKYSYMPKSKIEFWETKFRNNVRRDQAVIEELAAKKIKCLIIWECTIKKMKKSEEVCSDTMNRIKEYLITDDLFAEL